MYSTGKTWKSNKTATELYSLDLARKSVTDSARVNFGFPGDSVVMNLAANARDTGLILGSGRYPGVGNGNPLQYSCLGNPMDRGA